MRIGFVNTGTLQQNASTIRCLQLGKLLAQNGHDVFLFISAQPENIAQYGERVQGIQIKYSAVGLPREQITKTMLMSKIKLDTIHCMSSGSSVHFPGWLAKQKQRGRPRLIMDFDEWQSLWLPYPKRLYQQAWEWFACKSSDRVIFASHYLGEHLGRYVAPTNRFYLPYALDWELFQTHAIGWETLRQHYQGRRLAVYMGSLLPQFDIGKILQAVREVSQSEPQILFLFIGAGSLRAQLEQQVQHEGLTEWVRFLGYLPDQAMTQHLCAADVLLFPIEDSILNRSRCPNKIFQYLAAKRPIITNRVGEVVHILGEQALYFDFNSPADFAQKIIMALHGNAPIPSESLVVQNSWAQRYTTYLDILG